MSILLASDKGTKRWFQRLETDMDVKEQFTEEMQWDLKLTLT